MHQQVICAGSCHTQLHRVQLCNVRSILFAKADKAGAYLQMASLSTQVTCISDSCVNCCESAVGRHSRRLSTESSFPSAGQAECEPACIRFINMACA